MLDLAATKVVRGGSNLYSFAPSEAAGLDYENPRYCPRGILSAEHFAVRGRKYASTLR